MVHLLAKTKGINLLAQDKDDFSVLQSLLRTNGECAKALLSTGIATNGKEDTDPGLEIIYNLDQFAKKSEVRYAFQ